MEAKFMTLEEVAEYLRVHPSTIYRLLKKPRTGRIPAFKVGRDWRFTIESVDLWRKELERGQGNADSRG